MVESPPLKAPRPDVSERGTRDSGRVVHIESGQLSFHVFPNASRAALAVWSPSATNGDFGHGCNSVGSIRYPGLERIWWVGRS